MTARVSRTVMSFRPGGVIDLACPSTDAVDFRHMADRLARQFRFNGEPAAISVAQHCVMGAEALHKETRDDMLAALFVLHDGHEWILTDMTRPVASLLEANIPKFRAIWAQIKLDWDEQIYRAAALPGPSSWTEQQAATIKLMDERMCAVETLALFGPRAMSVYPASARKAPQLQEGLKPWPAEKAAERFLSSLSRYVGRSFR